MTKYLYHYCSIDTLKLILGNKTIRFSSLGKVDDMEEALTSDFDDIGRICFVSCWTDLEQESIEMWRSYTQGAPGVRIGLPGNFFSSEWEAFEESKSIKKSNQIGDMYDVQLSPPYYPVAIPVTYTKDEELINIPVANEIVDVCTECGKTTANFNLETKYIGRFKREYWSGQAEWRYKLIAIPKQYYNQHGEGRYLDGEPQEMIKLMKNDLKSMAFKTDYIDFPFNNNILDNINIISSPYNSADDNLVIKKAVRKFTNFKKFQVQKSKLKIRI